MRGWEAMSIALLGRLKNELGNRLEVTPSPKLQLCASHKCGSVRPLDCPPERRGSTGWVRRDLFPAAEPRPGCAARGSRMSPTPPLLDRVPENNAKHPEIRMGMPARSWQAQRTSQGQPAVSTTARTRRCGTAGVKRESKTCVSPGSRRGAGNLEVEKTWKLGQNQKTNLLSTKSREFSRDPITVGMPHISEAVVSTHIKPMTVRWPTMMPIFWYRGRRVWWLVWPTAGENEMLKNPTHTPRGVWEVRGVYWCSCKRGANSGHGDARKRRGQWWFYLFYRDCPVRVPGKGGKKGGGGWEEG